MKADTPYQRKGRNAYWARVWTEWQEAWEAGLPGVYLPILERLRVRVLAGCVALTHADDDEDVHAGRMALRSMEGFPACADTGEVWREAKHALGAALYGVEGIVRGCDLDAPLADAEAARLARTFKRLGLAPPIRVRPTLPRRYLPSDSSGVGW